MVDVQEEEVGVIQTRLYSHFEQPNQLHKHPPSRSLYVFLHLIHILLLLLLRRLIKYSKRVDFDFNNHFSVVFHAPHVNITSSSTVAEEEKLNQINCPFIRQQSVIVISFLFGKFLLFISFISSCSIGACAIKTQNHLKIAHLFVFKQRTNESWVSSHWLSSELYLSSPISLSRLTSRFTNR